MSDGQSAALWTEVVRELRGDAALIVPAHDATPAVRAWSSLIVSRVDAWQSETAQLALLFAPTQRPEVVRIVIGNGGGEDAFAPNATTIGFDAARLHAEYGDATTSANLERIDRFFRHEYTHLLQKAWLAEHPYAADTPMRQALLGMWLEGLGNYYSLSSRWRDAHGALTASAQETLAKLAPRLVARLSALSCAPPEQSSVLLRNLSMGPFTEKWGALPVALWLAQEELRSKEALRAFVLAGPDGVWALCGRSLSPELHAVLQEARANVSACSGEGSR